MFATITGTGDGTAPTVNLTFPFLDQSHVKAMVDGETVSLNWTGASQVQFASAVASGSPWKVYRETPTNPPVVDFTDTSVLTEAVLDKADKSHRYRDEELADMTAQVVSDAEQDRIISETALSNDLSNETAARINADNALLAAISGTTLESASLPAASRAFMAALDHSTGTPAFLYETGREGLFVPINADLSTEVTADPNQGIYVAFSSDPTGAGGAWRRATDAVFADHFGAVPDGVTDSGPKLNQALITMNALGLTVLNLRPGTYYSSISILMTSGVELRGHGATISSDANYVVGDLNSTTGYTIRDTVFMQIAGSTSKYVFDFHGSYITLRDFEAVTSPATHAVTGYIRGSSAYLDADGFTASGANGVFISGHDHKISNYDLTNGGGSDDGWVFKAAGTSLANAQTYNVLLSDGIIRGYGAAIAFGSEVGLQLADDPGRNNYIRNIIVDGLLAISCSQVVYLKPGAIYDYRDGTLQDLYFSNIQAIDLTGTQMRRFAYIEWARGAWIKNVHFNNITARFRTPDRSAGTNAGIVFATFDYTGGANTSVVDGIYIDGMKIVDPNGGAGPGGSAPGYPIDNFISVDATSGNGGVMGQLRRMEIKGLHGDGAARAAISIPGNGGAAVVGPVRMHSPIIENYAAAPLSSADYAGFQNAAPIEIIGHLFSTPSSAAPATTRAVKGDGSPSPTVDVIGETQTIRLGDLAAGATAYAQFEAPRDAWISAIELVSRTAVAADATNKVTVIATNKDTGAQLVNKDSNTGFAVAAFTPVSVNGSTKFLGANAYLRKGKVLDISVASAGTATLQAATLVIHYVPYGAA